jgi:hypothetical protein
MWENILEPPRPQITICRMQCTCCITKAKHTHSEYIILFFHSNNGYANAPPYYILHIHCLPCSFLYELECLQVWISDFNDGYNWETKYSETIYQTSWKTLMFVPCIVRRSINNQHYALTYTKPLFNIQAPTCFGSSLPSSGSFLDPSEVHWNADQISGISKICNG